MQIYAAARATVQQCIFATLPRHHCGRHRGRAGARRGRLGVEEEEKSHTVFIFLCIYCADRLFCVPQTTGEKSRSHRTRQPGSEDGDRSHGRRHHASELFLFFCASTVLTVYFVFHFSLSNNRRKIEESPDPPTW